MNQAKVNDYRRVRLDINSSMTDEQIREVCENSGNNAIYSTDICRNCGSYLCELSGDSKTAKITNSCANCHQF